MSHYNDAYMYYATSKQHLKLNSWKSNNKPALKKSVAYEKACSILNMKKQLSLMDLCVYPVFHWGDDVV